MTSLSATHRKLLRLAWLARAGTVETKFRQLIRTLKAGFDPNQPRVPAGNPRGGQWTEAGPAALGEDETELAQGEPLRGYRIDLGQEEARGGHTIAEHVGKSPGYLTDRVRREAARIMDRGDLFSGLSIGSFTSLQSATRLVNATLSRNPAEVGSVASGAQRADIVSARFQTVTGYEAYLPTYHAEPFMRETYSVDVFIIHDPRTAYGFRVQSAFPTK